MRFLIRIGLVLSLSTFITCHSKSQVYNDLNDHGYKGKIRSLTIKCYADIVQTQEGWKIKDTLNPTTIISYDCNQNGNFTRKRVTSKTDSFQQIFEYDGKIKTGWKRNDIDEVGRFTYNGNDGFSEISFNANGTKVFESIYIFGKDQRTKTLEDIGYKYDGSISFHLFTTFDDDAEGHLKKVKTIDNLKKTTENIEFQMLKNDEHNNPLKILIIKNDKEFQIRQITIEYE